jgi:hypothetical protein
VANTERSEKFSTEDAQILSIIAQSVAQFLSNEKQAFFDRINVQRQLDATMMSTQLEGNQLN